MPFVVGDSKKDFINYVQETNFIKDIFGNIFILSFIIVLMIMLIIFLTQRDEKSLLTPLLYCSSVIYIFLLIHNSIIKEKYKLKVGSNMDKDFEIMTNEINIKPRPFEIKKVSGGEFEIPPDDLLSDDPQDDLPSDELQNNIADELNILDDIMPEI